MSAQAVMPPDALAATQRVQQLQTLIAQARQGGSTAGFAAALAAASADPTADQSTALPQASAQSAALPPTPTAAPAPTEAAAGAGLPSATSAGSSPYDATIAQVAAREGLDPAVLHGLIQQESGFDPSARSSAGALGLTQLMPSTAASLGVAEPLNPTQSIEGGAHYLKEMLERFGGNTADALAAYNAGPGAVQQYGGVPPYGETQEYVSKVMANANAYRQSNPGLASPSTTATGAVA